MRRLLWGGAALVVCLLAARPAVMSAQGTACDSPCKVIPLPLTGPHGAVCDSPCKLMLLPLISQRAQPAQTSLPFVVGTVDSTGQFVTGRFVRTPTMRLPSATHAYFEYQVDERAVPAPGNPQPVFPQSLKRASIEGEVVTAFVIDTMGRVDLASFEVRKSTNPMFTAAVRKVLPRLRFIPAEIAGVKVKEFVQRPFVFRLPH